MTTNSRMYMRGRKNLVNSSSCLLVLVDILKILQSMNNTAIPNCLIITSSRSGDKIIKVNEEKLLR